MPKNFNPYGGVNSIAIERRNIIKRALSEGKPVPEEVLADYPELTKKLPAEAEIEVVKDIPEDFEPSMNDKLNEATNLAVELAFEDLEKGIPRDTDKIFGEELSNKIGSYVDGLYQKWIFNNIKGRTSIKSMLEFDIEKEEKNIENDILKFKELLQTVKGTKEAKPEEKPAETVELAKPEEKPEIGVETEELKKPEIPKELEQLVEEFAEKKLNVAPTKQNEGLLADIVRKYGEDIRTGKIIS